MNFAYSLAHYFYPRHSNNHKAKVLHTSSLFFLVLVLFAFQVILQAAPLAGLKILGYAANIPPSEVISMTNQKRQEAGLSVLEYSSLLEEAARLKGEHMLANDYWSHVAPDGTEPWTFFINSDYKYRYAGENLARDFSNSSSAIDAWMASPSHKENLLSAKYHEIGVAVVEGDLNGVDTTIIVQLFGTQLADSSSQIPLAQARSQATQAPSPAPTVVLEPTLIPVVARISPKPPPDENIITATGLVGEKAGVISPFDTTRSISLAVIILLLVIMVVDGLVVARRKIPRIGGRTFAHLAFLGMVLALVFIARAGEIL